MCVYVCVCVCVCVCMTLVLSYVLISLFFLINSHAMHYFTDIEYIHSLGMHKTLESKSLFNIV
jgi:hypothetical protein